MSKSAAVLIHDHHVGAGTVPKILAEHGFSTKVYFTPGHDFTASEHADLLVVMGGPVGAYEADRYAFLQQEMDILQSRLRTGLPTLGICLGAQLMAKALGAEVYKGKQGPETGWLDIHVTAEGAMHPVRHLDAGQTKVMQWHGDTFDLPPGATLLASSPLYTQQAFSYGTHGVALQCHPEVDAALAVEWIEALETRELMNAAESLGDGKKRLLLETKHYSDTLVTQMKLFMQDWLRSTGLI